MGGSLVFGSLISNFILGGDYFGMLHLFNIGEKSREKVFDNSIFLVVDSCRGMKTICNGFCDD